MLLVTAFYQWGTVHIVEELILLWGDGSSNCVLLAILVLLLQSLPGSVVLLKLEGLLRLYFGLL